MSEGPHGIYPILYAYFDENGGLDRNGLRRQIESCIATGAHGIALLGLITEVGKLSVAERERIVEWAAEDIGARVPLAVTIAGESPDEQLALARVAIGAGADWLILQPPQGHRPDEAELMRFFGKIMDGCSVPVGIQNFPEVLGVGLGPRAVGELHRQHANFTVMKGEAPVYQIRRYLDASNGEIGIFNGRGGIELADNLRAGCAGIIPAPDCADVQVAMYRAFEAGDTARLDQLYAQSLPYVIFVMQSIGFALTYGKALTARRIGFAGNTAPRDPDVEMDDFGRERLAAHGAFLGPFGSWQEIGSGPQS